MLDIFEEEKPYLHINKRTATGLVAVRLYLKVGKPRYPLSQCQLNDIIREFGIRKGLKKLVISSKIRIFIGENQ